MGQQQRELEVTVLSAEDLKNVLFGGAMAAKLGRVMDPYCVAWIDPHMKQSSTVSKRGGSNPTWNSIISLAVEESKKKDSAVTVEIYHHSKKSNKLIGTATVPLNAKHSASYDVRTKPGKIKGVINVAVKIGKVLSEAEYMAKFAAPGVGVSAMGQSYQQQQLKQPKRSYFGGGGGGGRDGVGSFMGFLGGFILASALDGGGGFGGGCGGGGGF